jgi:hypothetical protein
MLPFQIIIKWHSLYSSDSWRMAKLAFTDYFKFEQLIFYNNLMKLGGSLGNVPQKYFYRT